MYTRKKLPKSQYELSKGTKNREYERDNDIRRDNDTLKELNIGLYDIDYAVKYYFEQVIKPEIVEFGDIVKVPVIYGSPEKWKNVQADGYFRDLNGKIQSPLIAYKRTAVTKNRGLANKVDGNFPNLYYNQEVAYTQINKYDQFSVLNNAKPTKTYINTVVPDYIDVTYDVLMWTDYVESMNTLVESVIYTEGAYWGDTEKFKFRSKIDSLTNTTDLLQDADRVVRTSFQLTIFGYIVPNVPAKELSKKQSNKTIDTRQFVIETTPDVDPTVFQEKEQAVIGGAEIVTPTISSAPNPTSTLNDSVINYLNTNKAIKATTITVPNTVYFNGSFLTAPSPLPATSKLNFTFFVNGKYMEAPAILTFTESSGICTLTVDTAELGYTLSISDEVVAVGKFA